MGRVLGIAAAVAAGAAGFGVGAATDPFEREPGTEACGEAEGIDDYAAYADAEFTTITAERETPVFLLPNGDEILCTLKVGQTVLAGCHFTSGTIGVDSIEVIGEDTHGYAHMWDRDADNSPIDVFDASSDQLNDREDCVFVPPRA